MTGPRPDRLGALDASFLRLETRETPMHIGAVVILEGDPLRDADGRLRIEDLRHLVESRLHLIPRFRKRVVEVPFDLGRPVWADDDRFDIAAHVRLTALPQPGTWDQLVTLTERLQEHPLHRDRPLWELWFVDGLEDGRIAFIQKTHHALVDGVSGVDVATVLLDITPEPAVFTPLPWTPDPAPSAATLVYEAVRAWIAEPAAIGAGLEHILHAPLEAAHRARRLIGAVQSLWSGRPLAPHTSVNVPVGRSRRFATVQIDLASVKEVRAALGGTVNDVVLAAVTGGFRSLFEGRGEIRDAEFTLRALCPVSVRSDDERGELGNRVSGMIVPLPVGAPDAESRLRMIRAATYDAKERHQAVAADFLVGLADYAAPTLLSLAARFAHHQPLFNVVVTNVPGPQVPLYCMGAEVVAGYPIVPLARNLDVGVALLSYCGAISVGLFADRDAVADLDVLARGISEGVDALLRASRTA